MINCPFCKIEENLDNEVILYKDDIVLAFMDIRQINIGEVLVIPKRHVKNIFGLSEKELTAISKVVQLVANAVRKSFSAEGVMIYQLNGKTQEIPHLHIHIIPRYKDDEYSKVMSKIINENKSQKFISSIEDRREYAKRIIATLQSTSPNSG